MNKKNLTRLLRILFLLCVGAYAIHASLTRPRILVLHSYYTNFSWDTDMDIGIQKVLQDMPYNVRYHYMDTKRNPSEAFKEKAGIRAREVIDEWRPDVVIALDDNAQQYVTRYYVNDPKLTILFAGVNGNLSKYGFDKADNVTGITEDLPWEATIGQLGKMLPPGSRLLHISDASESSVAVHDSILAVDWGPFQMLGSIQVHDFAEWQKTVREAEGQADALLITHYHTIRDPADPSKVVEPASIIRWTEANTSLLTLGFWGFFVADGGMVAVGLSPFEQGEEPARMAVQIIEKNMKAAQIERKKARLYVMYVRKAAYEKRLGKGVPIEIEAFAKAANGFYE